MNKVKSDAPAQCKPLEKLKFFLDFKGHRPQTQLVRDLKNLGAVVEPFFGRDVTHVITDKQDCKASRKPNSVDSSGQTTSPFSNECSHDLPCTSASMDAKVVPRIQARGQAMVQRAVRATPGRTDILELCRLWQIKVLYIKNFLPWLQQLKQKALLSKTGKENVAKAKQKSDVPQKLVPPFIKLEDPKCVYRPLFKSLKQWPDISTEQFSEPTPKTIAVPAREHVASTQARGVLLTPDTAKAIPKTTPKIKVTEQKKFNCEICCCSYLCLQKHLESERHQEFMKNASNFSVLGELMSTLRYTAPGPLTEIHLQSSASSADGSPSNECGRKLPTSRAMLSVKDERSGIVVQSTYRGSLSSVKHLKVVRRLTEPIAKATPTSPKKVPNPRKRPLLCSDIGPSATRDDGDAKPNVCCSDPFNVEKADHLVPPSHSTDVDATENGLLANMCVESSAADGRVAAEEQSNFVENVQIGTFRDLVAKLVPESQREPSTMEYSWTDVASGFAVESGFSRKRRATGSGYSDDSSFSKLISAIGAGNFSEGSECKDASDADLNGLAEGTPSDNAQLDSSLCF